MLLHLSLGECWLLLHLLLLPPGGPVLSLHPRHLTVPQHLVQSLHLLQRLGLRDHHLDLANLIIIIIKIIIFIATFRAANELSR